MKKIESLMILRGVNVTELMQAAGLERATYYYIKKKGGTISDGAFITAMVLILLAVFFMRLGFAAEAREKRPRKIHKPQANTVKSGRKAG